MKPTAIRADQIKAGDYLLNLNRVTEVITWEAAGLVEVKLYNDNGSTAIDRPEVWYHRESIVWIEG